MKYASKYIEVSEADLERFGEIHPGHGSFSWFIREALSKYLKLHDVNSNELIGLAVENITKIDES